MVIETKTGKAELCFVKVPEDAEDFDLEISIDDYLAQLNYLLLNDDEDSSFRGEHYIESIDIPIGNWQIVGNPFELSQEVIKDLVPEMKGSGFPFEVQEITDTWKDILDKWKIYHANPYPDPELTMRQGDGYVYYGASDEEFSEYAEAEERTGSFILLKKI